MSIEDIKSFWNARPCNIRHSSKDKNTREYFEEVEWKKYTAEPHIVEFAEFSKWKGKQVLEIGCGIGTAVISFAKAGAHVTAIDLSDVSVELCKRRLELYNLSAEIYTGNAENLADILPPKKYDLIYSFGVIHHSPNPGAIIAQLANYIHPDGELRLMLYSLVSYKLFDVMRQTEWDMSKIRSIMQNYSEAQVGCPCTYLYSFQDVSNLLNPYFKVEKIWKDHIFTWDIEEYKKGNFVKAAEWRNVDEATLKSLERELGWHTLILASNGNSGS